MSNGESKVPERLRLVGATDLERRMLDAAGREQPSRELSERMARAIGVTLPSEGAAGAGDGGTAPAAPAASSSALPWVAGALVTAAVAAGVVFATRSGSPSSQLPAEAGSVAAVSTARAPATPASGLNAPVEGPAAPAPLPAGVRSGLPPSPLRGSGTTTADLGEQIALLDAARGAIGRGEAERALGVVRKYQTQYPGGAFRPEAAAIRIDALMKLGRTAEARNLAERFASSYGSGPLADRVARSAGLGQP